MMKSHMLKCCLYFKRVALKMVLEDPIHNFDHILVEAIKLWRNLAKWRYYTLIIRSILVTLMKMPKI